MIYVYVVPVGIDYRLPVGTDIYVYVGPVGMECRVSVSMDIITLQNDSYICGASGHRIQSPSQQPSKRIYVYVVPVDIDYRFPVSIDIYVYVWPLGIEYRVPISMGIITLQNDSCICGADGHRIQSPSQHRYYKTQE